MDTWTCALRQKGNLHRLASSLETNRFVDETLLRASGLPQYSWRQGSLEEFMDDPEFFLKDFPKGRFYVTLNPSEGKSGVQRHSKPNISGISGILAFGKEVCQFPLSPKDYDILVKEFEPNIVGGSILSKASGEVWAELVQGTQLPVAQGSGQNYFTAMLKSGSMAPSYNTENAEMNAFLEGALLAIREPGTVATYLQGYFEFVYTKHRGYSGELFPRLVFLDFKTCPTYIK